MCPPAPVPPAADISVYWTDEELSLCLVKIILGSPLPGNVFAEVNPYQYRPSNLPDGVWFFIRSEQKKYTELGFWKAKGEPCEIFSNATITGWRTTLEFYEGQAPHEKKTEWIMQDYMISQKGLHENRKPKGSGSLCRVFLSGGRSPNHKNHDKQGGTDSAVRNHFNSMAAVPNADNTSGQGSTSESQVKNRDDAVRLLTVNRTLQNLPVENLPTNDSILRGDYLELDDLADPETSSSSSENSSQQSFSSDEYFNSLALLRDLGSGINQDLQGKDANCKFSVSASARPNEVVLCPVTLGSLVSSNGSKLTTEETQKSGFSIPGSAIEGKFIDKRTPKHAIKTRKSDHRSKGTSNSKAGASSSGHKAVPEVENKAINGRMKKLRKKYLCCCMAF